MIKYLLKFYFIEKGLSSDVKCFMKVFEYIMSKSGSRLSPLFKMVVCYCNFFDVLLRDWTLKIITNIVTFSTFCFETGL